MLSIPQLFLLVSLLHEKVLSMLTYFKVINCIFSAAYEMIILDTHFLFYFQVLLEIEMRVRQLLCVECINL